MENSRGAVMTLSVERVLAEARRRVEASGTVITSEMILEARDADRR
ncbi:MAG: hypothetical protein OXB92_13060 [Acidimicrobiaceae bacterium]|nr:hypothetical protein [Acidimicrobiia bacterium]MCY4494778.1 hypothetical protein [Acidimicrobiaceae bacterium]